jgi:putative ABC transport system ATP-binding protein
VVAGIEPVDAGEVTVADHRLDCLSERERTLFRRRHVGLVFQFFNLIPTLTVEENAVLHLEMQGRVDRAARRTVRDLLAEVGLGDRLDSWPDRLSGGEQQRVAVVAALVHEPAVVLADEPTGNLDGESEEGVVTLLDRLTRRAGRTLVLVTHSDRVARIADRVVTLEETMASAPPREGVTR